MKAITFRQYGSPDVLKYEDVPTPTPKDDEVLIKLHASSVNAADWHLLRADPFPVRFMLGLTKPKPKFHILGGDVAGVIEAIGKNVTEFKVGDEVFGETFDDGMGGFAEYTCARAKILVAKPKNLNFEEAAAVPLAAVTAFFGLRDVAKVQPGQNVLINGAAGGVGTYAVQIAKALGAEVTAVCSARNHEQARSLGADHVIDYTKENFTKSGKQYDVILCVNGYYPIRDFKRTLTPNGIYAMPGGNSKLLLEVMFLGPLHSLGSKKFKMVASKPNKARLQAVKDLIEGGKLHPVIEKVYPLAEVPDAIRYVETGHARGKVVITVP
ncbi:MAG: NAD(P)-dependent alcohol dehydrogenase [bacterium]|nr:NAD(P)-dependent alcohol dehydrogenase [bacterium]